MGLIRKTIGQLTPEELSAFKQILVERSSLQKLMESFARTQTQLIAENALKFDGFWAAVKPRSPDCMRPDAQIDDTTGELFLMVPEPPPAPPANDETEHPSPGNGWGPKGDKASAEPASDAPASELAPTPVPAPAEPPAEGGDGAAATEPPTDAAAPEPAPEPAPGVPAVDAPPPAEIPNQITP
jgi:hypothetical protein